MANVKVEVKNLAGKVVGSVELDEEIFAAPLNEHLLWEVVKLQRAKARAGTHSTKRRDEVRGGGKKPWKQKGSGQARAGSSRSPVFVGGGGVFTPKPRDYSYTMPKKAMAGALRIALSQRVREGKMVVVDKLAFDAIKTQQVDSALDTLGTNTALVVNHNNQKLKLSTRNLQRAKYLEPQGVNVYDLLNFESLVVSQAALEQLSVRLRPTAEGGGAA